MSKRIKKPLILSVLFFLPVIFLLFLYPSTHNYDPLEVVKEKVEEITSDKEKSLEGHITVLTFFGNKPMSKALAASNLKELVYDKFKGFKKFQIVSVLPEEARPQLDELKQELVNYDELKYWKFVFGNEADIRELFNSLNPKVTLDDNLTTHHVFIVDKDVNLRGRLDDRTVIEVKKKKPIYGLNSYDCIAIKELKDKLSEDLRILFTEYRQKRKGNFNSTSRRAEDLKGNN